MNEPTLGLRVSADDRNIYENTSLTASCTCFLQQCKKATRRTLEITLGRLDIKVVKRVPSVLA